MPRPAAVRRPSPGRLAAAVPAVLVGALVAALAVPPPAAATEVKIFQTQSQRAFLAGTLEGIGVDPLGRLRLADRSERLTAIGEPFLLSAARHPEGWVVGTGNAGRVLLVRENGRVEQLFAADEPEVFAVWAADDGTVYAGTSPNGKVYRIPAAGADSGGEPITWFEPGETYVWDLAPAPGGDGLLVATGTQGKLFHVTGRGAGAVVYDSDDTHLRTIAVLPDGGVLVGTAGEGFLQVLAPRPGTWGVRTLYDAREPEVVALAVAPDGTRYAAVAASEASPVDLGTSAAGSSPSGQDEPGSGQGEEDGGTVTVTVTPEDGPPSAGASPGTGSRRPGYRGPRSQVLAVSPAGVVETLWSFEDETVFDLLWHRGRLWVGTGLDGELFSWTGSQMVLEKDVDERQIVALLPGEHGPAFATTNAAALYRVTGGTEREGVYTSAALDAEQISRFGTFRWRGEVPRRAAVSFSFRSGISAEPDRTWSEWSEWSEPARGPLAGGEVGLGELPRGRYAQWRARLSAGDGESPLVYGIELTYRQENLRPKIERLAVLEPGRILVPASFNPSDQAFEPVSQAPEGVFRTLEPAPAGDGRLKTLWKPGYRSLTWDAEDDNGDELIYRLAFRPAEAGEAGAAGDGGGRSGLDAVDTAAATAAAAGDGWLPMVADLSDEHYVFDSTVLPDGVYRFRLVASDRPDNAPGEALAAERLSEPVVVDHTPPRLVSSERAEEGRLRVVVEDALSPLVRARLSTDAGEWTDLVPEDGLLDGRRETFVLAVPAAARLVLLQVGDAAYNGVTFDLGRR